MRIKFAPEAKNAAAWLAVCAVGTFLFWLADVISKAQ